MVKKYETIAVVVTYNRKELLKECLTALLNCNGADKLGVLIIDNHSSDGTKDYIKDFLAKKNVFYYDTGENLGGAGGFNIGIRRAYSLAKKYVWVMDDDCIVQKNTLVAFIKFAKEKRDNFGFLGSKVLWKDKSIAKFTVQREKIFLPLRNFDRSTRVVCNSFVSCFINKEIIKELGLPIKDFFIWTDDWEYTRRISRKYQCYFIADSVVMHKSKKNTDGNIVLENGERLPRYKYIYRNEYYLYRREGFWGLLYIFLRNRYNYIMILLKSKSKKLEKINLIRYATKEGKTFFPEIEKITEEDK